MNHDANIKAHNIYPQMNTDKHRWDVNLLSSSPVVSTYENAQPKNLGTAMKPYGFICVYLRSSVDNHSSSIHKDNPHRVHYSLTSRPSYESVFDIYPQINTDKHRCDVNLLSSTPVVSTYENTQPKNLRMAMKPYGFICVHLCSSVDNHSSSIHKDNPHRVRYSLTSRPSYESVFDIYPQINTDKHRCDVNLLSSTPVVSTYENTQPKNLRMALKPYVFICVHLRSSVDNHSSSIHKDNPHRVRYSLTSRLSYESVFDIYSQINTDKHRCDVNLLSSTPVVSTYENTQPKNLGTAFNPYGFICVHLCSSVDNHSSSPYEANPQRLNDSSIHKALYPSVVSFLKRAKP